MRAIDKAQKSFPKLICSDPDEWIEIKCLFEFSEKVNTAFAAVTRTQLGHKIPDTAHAWDILLLKNILKVHLKFLNCWINCNWQLFVSYRNIYWKYI